MIIEGGAKQRTLVEQFAGDEIFMLGASSFTRWKGCANGNYTDSFRNKEENIGRVRKASGVRRFDSSRDCGRQYHKNAFVIYTVSSRSRLYYKYDTRVLAITYGILYKSR
jgi:hypothetical protein